MLDKNSSQPMYEQIAGILRTEIARMQPGRTGPIGTHSALAERFGVSMITVRKAVAQLIGEGLLITKPGKGTYLNRLPLQDGFNHLTGMSTVIAMNNLVADVSVREMRYIETPPGFPESARTGLGPQCLFIERTHAVGIDVIGLAHITIPDKYAKQFSREDVSRHTIYYLYQNKLRVPLGNGVQNITAVPAGPKIAQTLGVAKKSPLLMLERFSYSAEGEFLEYMTAYYAYNRYSFRVELGLSAE